MMSSPFDTSSSSTGGGSSSGASSYTDQRKDTSNEESYRREEIEEEEQEEEDVENMILELREIYRQSVTTTFSFDESGDSLDADNTEEIKAKLRALRDYVNDLQLNYDELLDTFGQLEAAANKEIKTLKDKLANALNSTKDYRERCTKLEGMVKDGNPMEINEQLENIENDLSAILGAIAEGMSTGVIKLSQLSLSSQEDPLPLQDIIISGRGFGEAPLKTKTVSTSDVATLTEQSRSPSQDTMYVTATSSLLNNSSTTSPGVIPLTGSASSGVKPTGSRLPDSASSLANTDTVSSGVKPADSRLPGSASSLTNTDSASSGVKPADSKLPGSASSLANTDSASSGVKPADSRLPDSASSLTNTDFVSSGIKPADSRLPGSASSLANTDSVSSGVKPADSRLPDSASSLTNTDFVSSVVKPADSRLPGSASSLANTDSASSGVKPTDSTLSDFASPCVTETRSSTDSLLHDAVQMKSTDSLSPNAISSESSTNSLSSRVIPLKSSDAVAPVLVLAKSPTNLVSLKGVVNDSTSEADVLTPHTPHTPLSQYYDEDDDEAVAMFTPIVERDYRIAELETRVQELEFQLQESEHARDVLINESHSNMRQNYWSNVSIRDNETRDVMLQVDQLSEEREELLTEIEGERERVRELERAQEAALKEVEELQLQIKSITPSQITGRDESSSTTDLESEQALLSAELLIHKAKIEKLSEENANLQAQREQLETNYQEVAATIEELQVSLREAKLDTHKVQTESAGKEAQMKRVLSLINTTRLQLANLCKSSSPPGDEGADSWSVDKLSNVDQVALRLGEDVSSLKEKWSELTAQLEETQCTIADLTGRELVLTSQLHQSTARVIVLESLLQARSTSLSGQEDALGKSRQTLDVLKEELKETKESYEASCEEMSQLQGKLKNAMMSTMTELEWHREQIKERDARISQLENETSDLWSLHNHTSLVLKEEENIHNERSDQLLAVEEELREARETIDQLENELMKESEGRMNELDYERTILIDIIDQLIGGSTEETMSEPSDLQTRLAQRDHLLSTLQEETVKLLETHSQTLHEVQERQRIVGELEQNLTVSQELCDTLDREVNNNKARLDAVQRELVESEREKAILAEQVLKLQVEAKETCRALEAALAKNTKLAQDNERSVTNLQDRLELERSASLSLEVKLNEAVSGVDSLTDGLRETVRELEAENDRLRMEKAHVEKAMSNLHEQLDEDSNKYQSMHKELSEALSLMEELKRQRSEARLSQNEAEALAEERLDDLSIVQEKYHTLHSVNQQLEEEIRSMKEGQDSLQQSFHDTKDSLQSLYDSKCLEYNKLQSEHYLLIEKDTVISQQLNECHRELEICQRRASELDSRYKDSLKELERTQSELDVLRTSGKPQQSSDRRATQKRLQLLTEKASLLEIQLNTTTERLEESEQALITVEQEKRKLLHKLSALEEHYTLLVRSHSQQKLELSHSQHKLGRQHKQYTTLQKDYDAVVEQIGEWAESHKSSSEGLINKIKEQDDEISSLKAQKRKALTENEALRGQLQQQERVPMARQVTTGPSLSSSLRNLDLQYQATLEKGMSSASAMDTSGYSSPTAVESSSDEMDKCYWIRRAGELSMQLQESSDYWSNRMRVQKLPKASST